jgi:hypothetical protein
MDFIFIIFPEELLELSGNEFHDLWFSEPCGNGTLDIVVVYNILETIWII